MLRATHTDFSAAIDRSSAAAGLESSTDAAVMAIGGFGGRSAHADIAKWVATTLTPMTIGSDTVYDLAAPTR